MPSKNELKYEHSRTFRHYLRELCLRGLPRTMYKSPKTFDKILKVAQDWMTFYLYRTGNRTNTRHFFAMDGRDFDDNPLAICMKTKEFKPTQLIIHLAILNLLNTETYIPVTTLLLGQNDKTRWKRHLDGEMGLVSSIFGEREHTFEDFHLPEKEIEIKHDSIRETLNCYVEFGLLDWRVNANRHEYRIHKESFALEQTKDYLSFWSGLSPIELAGSIVKDRCIRRFGMIEESPFRFKYRYLHHILDAEVIETAFNGIRGHHPIVVQMACRLNADAPPNHIPDHFELKTIEKTRGYTTTIIPFKLYISVLTGRRYLMGLFNESLDLACLRVDRIEQAAIVTKNIDEKNYKVTLSEEEYLQYSERFSKIASHLWGVSYHGDTSQIVHVSFEVTDPRPYAPKVKRLAREKRCGTVTQITSNRARFDADVWDGREMFPWIRTYIGYLSNLSFSDSKLTDLFWRQIQHLRQNICKD